MRKYCTKGVCWPIKEGGAEKIFEEEPGKKGLTKF